MSNQGVFLLLLIGLSMPEVFCKHDYEYYIDKYHKVSSTTESTSSSLSVSSTTESTSSSLSGVSATTATSIPENLSSEELSSPSHEPKRTTELEANETLLQYGNPYDDNTVQYVFIIRIVIIVGSVILAVVVLGCIVCCCPGCCRGNQRRGFIIRDSREGNVGTEVHPQQPLVTPCQQPGAVVQHFPPNYSSTEAPQQFPPQYQHPVQQYSPQYQQPVQQFPPQHQQQEPQQFQYPPTTTLQFYNPPEAPPPYEDMPTHKN